MEISAAAGRIGGAVAVQRTDAAVVRSGEAAEQAGTAAPPREPGPPCGIASTSEARGLPATALLEAAVPVAEPEAAALAEERPAEGRETAASGAAREVERGRDAGEAGRSVRVETPGADRGAEAREAREAGRAAGKEAGDRALARSAETAYAAAVSTLTAQARGETTELFV